MYQRIFMVFKNYFSPILLMILTSLLLFFIHIFLWAHYNTVFNDLSTYEILQSTPLGLCIGLISVLTFTSVLILFRLQLKLIFNSYMPIGSSPLDTIPLSKICYYRTMYLYQDSENLTKREQVGQRT